jgi:hypothetical protein
MLKKTGIEPLKFTGETVLPGMLCCFFDTGSSVTLYIQVGRVKKKSDLFRAWALWRRLGVQQGLTGKSNVYSVISR